MISLCHKSIIWSSQRLFILQTQDKVKLLCRDKKTTRIHNQPTTLYTTLKEDTKWDLSPAVRGCTESLALVKSAMAFRGPPLAWCCRWYFFSSDRGRKRFIILWYWTSTWEREENKISLNAGLLLLLVIVLLLPEWVYHAPFGVVRFTVGIEMDVFLVKLSVVHIRFLHNLVRRNTAKYHHSNH